MTQRTFFERKLSNRAEQPTFSESTKFRLVKKDKQINNMQAQFPIAPHPLHLGFHFLCKLQNASFVSFSTLHLSR
ncbi:hypothetical protein T12_8414 [Trichinella patagoniensis]|uniref:Uncharacterized protein n=1 Tax=Trichinella patagoniensis TaxID=990121 RepID=A0A0V0ZGU4_9BILA|nr:hypothetical protein T12_8414 [Trichinella patagoniensis]